MGSVGHRWRRRAVGLVSQAERALDATVVAVLSRRPGWEVGVDAYLGHGTPTRLSLSARVVVRRSSRRVPVGTAQRLADSLGTYLGARVVGAAVRVELAGTGLDAVSDGGGYVHVEVDRAGDPLVPGWHQVTWNVGSTTTTSRALVVEPDATLGLVSDLDDTVIHTGMTRLADAVRTTLLVGEADRLPIPGAAALYRDLVHADGGRAPVFYVSSGAWNMHARMERFLGTHAFPDGPLLMNDWGPSERWLVHEDSVSFKSRTVLALMARHPRLRWVLVGDSGQHDPEAYATVVRAAPDRVHAVYVREVLPASVTRAAWVRAVAEELAGLGVPMLLLQDSAQAETHARSLGLLS